MITSGEIYYSVAGHRFGLDFSADYPCLSHYEPFITDDKADGSLFHLTVVGNSSDEQFCGVSADSERLCDALGEGEQYNGLLNENELFDEGEQIGHFADDSAAIMVYGRNGGGYIFHIAPPDKERCCMISTSADYRLAYVRFEGNCAYHSFGLDNCLMLLYTFASAPLDTLMLHASVIKYKGAGFLFLGKSGTGKSTHSRLWLEHIEGCELLNDDNPVIRVIDGKAMVYGSPWSGKTPCYKNDSAEVGAFVRLQQRPANEIVRNSVVQAFAALKPSCSSAPWDKGIHSGICDTLTKVIESVNTYTLGCLPDREAAELCRRTVAE